MDGVAEIRYMIFDDYILSAPSPDPKRRANSMDTFELFIEVLIENWIEDSSDYITYICTFSTHEIYRFCVGKRILC